MKSHLYHLQVNIDFKHAAFYKDLLTFMGWSSIHEDDHVVGYKSASSGDLWFLDATSTNTNSYDGVGVNHIALRVEHQADVDAVKDYLANRNTAMLFDTPKHRPEFSFGENQTYYQVMFESPDKILFEVVYIGAK